MLFLAPPQSLSVSLLLIARVGSCTVMQRVPSRAVSSCCRVDASRLHEERLPKAAWRIVAPAHGRDLVSRWQLGLSSDLQYISSIGHDGEVSFVRYAVGFEGNLEDFIGLQACVTDGRHQSSQCFWLKEEEDVDCMENEFGQDKDNTKGLADATIHHIQRKLVRLGAPATRTRVTGGRCSIWATC